MPATPRFKVSQTEDAVVVCIKVPHVRVGSAETHVDGTEFSFYCKPYLLRLTLPHEVGGEDVDGSCKAVYDPANDNGTITVTLAKAIPGLHFPDLDLTTTLMQPRWTPKDLLKERPSNSDPSGGSGGGEGAAPFSSGVEVISSEHYDVWDDDSDAAGDAEEAAAASTGPGPEGGATGADSTRALCGGGREGGKEDGGARAAARAGEVEGGLGAEVLIRPPSYGFNDKYSGFFASLREELREMIHLPDPDNTLPSARRGLRLEHEQAAFDADRYLGDLFTEDEDPLLTEALAFEAHWQRKLRRAQGRRRRRRRRQQQQQQRVQKEGVGSAGSGGGEAGSWGAVETGQEAGGREKGEIILSPEEEEEGEEDGFTEKEQEQMRRLPNREYLIEAGSQDERRVLLGLADILFAYAYDHRMTTGDASVESAWTVAVLSPLLSWLEVADEGERGNEVSPAAATATATATATAAVDGSVEADLALAGIRRSLIFPYLRVWELGALVARDVRDILAAGKRCVLRCLLQTYAIMERGEVHYLLNKLFIEDYCVWIQKASEESIAALAQRYAASLASATKGRADLDLERLEAEAVRLIAEGGGEGEDSGESSEEEEEEEEESSSDEDSSEEEETSGEEDSPSEEEEESGSSRGAEGSDKGSSSGQRDSGDGDGDGDKKEGRVGAAAGAEAAAVSVEEKRRASSTEVARKEDTGAAAPAATPAATAGAGAGAASAEAVEIREAEQAPPSSVAGNSKSTSGKDSGGGTTKEAPINATAVTSIPTVQEATNDIRTPTTAAAGRAQTSKDLLHLESLVGKASLGAGETAEGGEPSTALTSRLAVLGLGGQRGSNVSGDGGGGKDVVVKGGGCGADELPLSSEAAGRRAGSGDGGDGGGGAAKGPSGTRRKKLIEEL